jgi:hypothetical protein
MSAAACNPSCNPRTLLMELALRGSLTAFGLLCLAVLSAAAASAQTADLAVTQTAAPNPAPAGTRVLVPVTATNNGPSAANNVALVYLFPPDTTSTGILGVPPVGWTCGFSGNAMQCTIPTLATSASVNLTLHFQSEGQTPAGVVLVGDALITSTTVDPNPANNLATTNTTISPGGAPMLLADLAVTKTGPPPLRSGKRLPSPTR